MKQIKHFIKEITIVIAGILIALFINNWNEERKEKKYLNQIFSSIKNELKESLVDIKHVVPKQIASLDTIQVYLDNDDVSLYDIMIKSDGIYSPNIKTNSWNALANSKIELIKHEKLSALADIEERKKNLMDRIQKQTDFIFLNFEESGKRKKEILKIMISDVIGAEKRLQSKIEALLKIEF